MRIERKNNHSIIDSLTSLGHRVRIKHHRQWNPAIVYDRNKGATLTFRVANTGGTCRVTIETADGDIYEGLFTNHSKLQYNKNFAVHVALQRALINASKANEVNIESEGYGAPIYR